MPGHEAEHGDHAHFVCTGCEVGFCTAQGEYANMKEGDACPACHIATVTEVEMVAGPFPPGLNALVMLAKEVLNKQYEQAERRAVVDERRVIAEERKAAALDMLASSFDLIAGHLGRIEGALNEIADAFGADDRGRAALRVTGEVVSGEGDVREPA